MAVEERVAAGLVHAVRVQRLRHGATALPEAQQTRLVDPLDQPREPHLRSPHRSPLLGRRLHAQYRTQPRDRHLLEEAARDQGRAVDHDTAIQGLLAAALVVADLVTDLLAVVERTERRVFQRAALRGMQPQARLCVLQLHRHEDHARHVHVVEAAAWQRRPKACSRRPRDVGS